MLSEAKHLACLRQSAGFFVAALLRMTDGSRHRRSDAREACKGGDGRLYYTEDKADGAKLQDMQVFYNALLWAGTPEPATACLMLAGLAWPLRHGRKGTKGMRYVDARFEAARAPEMAIQFVV